MSTPENWCIDVNGQVYGPYSTDQMAHFVGERRLAYHSMVAPAGSRDFRQALQFKELKPLFQKRGAARESVSNRGNPLIVVFGTTEAAAQAADMLESCGPVIELSASASLIASNVSAEAVRDRLAAILPSAERALVLPANAGGAACHGVSLEELSRITAMGPRTS